MALLPFLVKSGPNPPEARKKGPFKNVFFALTSISVSGKFHELRFPFSGVTQKMHIKALSEEQIATLDRWLSSQAPKQFSPRALARVQLIFRLFLDAGLRVGELAALRWSNILQDGFDCHKVYIPAAIAKTNTAREIPATEALRRSVKTFWLLSGSSEDVPPSSFVFASKITNNPMTTRQIHRIVTIVTAQALGQAYSPHKLRHSFATRLMRRTSSRIVQELLGHKKLTSTQVYTHPDSADMIAAINSMGVSR